MGVSKKVQAETDRRRELRSTVVAAFGGENDELAKMILKAGYMDPRNGIKQGDIINAGVVSKSDLQRWSKEGLEFKRINGGKYFPVMTLIKFVVDKSVRRRLAQTDGTRQWAEKEAEYKAREREHKFKVSAGEYLPVEDVKKTWCEHINAVRKRLLAIPRAMATRLQGVNRRSTIEKIIKEEIYNALEEMGK